MNKVQTLFIVLLIAVVALLSYIIFSRGCYEGNKNNSKITISIDASPKSGPEPLNVKIKVYVESKLKINSIKVDFNGDKIYEFENHPNSTTFYQEFLTEIVAYDPPENLPLYGKDYWAEVTIYVSATDGISEEEKSEKVNVLWIGPPKFFLVADRCSGPPPLQVNFTVVMEEKPYDRYDFKWDCDGDGNYEKNTTENTFTCYFGTIGLYPSSVSVLSPNRRYKISPYIYCGKISQNLISKYIEVLSERILPNFIFSTPTIDNLDIEEDKIVLSGKTGMIISQDKDIKDIFGVFYLNPQGSEQITDISESKITSFPLDILSSKIWGSKIYFSSHSGTYAWEWDTKTIQKLLESPYYVFPYSSSNFLIISNLTGDMKVCSDEELKFCSDLSSGPNAVIDEIKIKKEANELHIVIRYQDGSLEYAKYNGKNAERRTLKIPEDFKYSVLKFDFNYPNLFLIPHGGSTLLYLFRIDNGDVSELIQPTIDTVFTDVSILGENKLILGLSEKVCGEGRTKSCNLAVFNIQKKSLEFFEGTEDIYLLKKSKNFIYQIKNSQEISRRSIIQVDDLTSIGKEEILFALPSGNLYDIQSDKNKIFILDRNSLIVFNYNGEYIGYYSNPSKGFKTSLYVSDLIFIGISDNRGTAEKEGKIIILDKDLKEVASFSDEEISYANINCITAAKTSNDNYLILICQDYSISILSYSSGKFTKVCENIIDSPAISVASDGDKFFVASYSKLYTINSYCQILDSKNSILSFTQIDIDRERKILFSAEGENHNFRIWDISSGYPREITRYSLDMGVEYDTAEGIAHIGNTLYLSSSYTGVIVFDISEISKPKLIKKVYLEDVSAGLRKCSALQDRSGIACLTSGSQIYFYK